MLLKNKAKPLTSFLSDNQYVSNMTKKRGKKCCSKIKQNHLPLFYLIISMCPI